MEQVLKQDRYFAPHVFYYVREMRIMAYSQLLESYNSLTLQYMANAFGVSVEFIDKYVCQRGCVMHVFGRARQWEEVCRSSRSGSPVCHVSVWMTAMVLCYAASLQSNQGVAVDWGQVLGVGTPKRRCCCFGLAVADSG